MPSTPYSQLPIPGGKFRSIFKAVVLIQKVSPAISFHSYFARQLLLWQQGYVNEVEAVLRVIARRSLVAHLYQRVVDIELKRGLFAAVLSQRPLLLYAVSHLQAQ